MIKLGKASLRGEIIRPVCKCKLLRNFLPSPTLSCTILLANLSRERECGKSKRECERRRKTENYLYMCVRIWSYMWHVWREDGEIEAGKKDKKAIGHVVQHGPTFDSEIQERKGNREAGKTRTTIENGRYHKCHYPSNPSAIESMRNEKCRTMNLDQILLDRKLGYSGLPSLPHAILFFIYTYIYTASYYIYYLIARNMLAVSPCSFRIIYHLTVFR